MSDPKIVAYNLLAKALTYPDAAYLGTLEQCREALQDLCPESAAHVAAFAERVAGTSLAELEELYIRTFDLNPLGALDLGWQLFGEEYNRGLFLVKLRTLMHQFHLADTAELPDHITHVLAILARMDDEAAVDFATACVIPAMRKVLDGVPKDNPYRGLVEAAMQLLETRYGAALEETAHG
jgi:nitrate reductase delta subunit